MMKHKKNQTGTAKAKRAPGSTTRKGRWSWLIFLLAVMTVIAAGLLGWLRSPEPAGIDRIGSTFAALRGDLMVTVTESGTIKARDTIDIRSEVWREGTIIRLVPEGTYITQEDVDAGRILVELDSSLRVR
jgi:hypothetical protein